MKIERVCGHTFVKGLIGKAGMVFDCGANHGDFSKWISDNLNATIHGFEPDPRLFSALQTLPNVFFHNVAVSGTGDELVLHLGETRCSSAYIPEKFDQKSVTVKSVRIDAFCQEQKISHIDLLKLDVEGAELEILERAPIDFLRNIGQITVEFHDFLSKSDVGRIHNIISRLRGCGFYCIRFTHHDYSDVLCINQRIHRLRSHWIWYLYIYKYVSGLMRLIRRQLDSCK